VPETTDGIWTCFTKDGHGSVQGYGPACCAELSEDADEGICLIDLSHIGRSRLLWAAAAPLVFLLAVLYCWRAYSNFREEISGLNLITLGDSRAEVVYKLGKPPAVLADPKPGVKFFDMLVYYPRRPP
jgi:hypothetical protein